MSLPADARLDRLIRQEELSGAFFLHGDALRLREEGLRRLVDAALDPATRDFNLSYFRGGELQMEPLAAAAAMPPMMATRRVVVLTEAELLSPSHRKVVVEILNKLPSDLTFIVAATVPKASKAAFYRTLKERCTALEWRQPREQEIPGWAMERARAKYDYELPADAAQALAAAVGANLSVLDMELSKLAGAAVNGAVSSQQVKELVSAVPNVDRWEWLDQVASRSYGVALAELETVLAQESAVGLVMAMVDQHLYVGLALEGGAGLIRQVLTEAKKPYLAWKARVYAEQARGWTKAELVRALRLMRRADRQLKSGGGQRATLEELLLALRVPASRAA